MMTYAKRPNYQIHLILGVKDVIWAKIIHSDSKKVISWKNRKQQRQTNMLKI